VAASLTTPLLQDPELLAPQQSELKRIVRTFLLSKIATLGALIFALFLLIALLSPILVPHDPASQDLKLRLAPPVGLGMDQASWEYPLGNDNLGRDILSRLMVGARISLLVGVSTILLSASVGSLIGAVAGFYRGTLDNVVMRLVDIWLAFPGLLLSIGVAAALGPGLVNLILALSLTSWTVYSRVVRADVLSIRERDYVLAARAMGASDSRIILRHILPNILAPIMIISSLRMGTVIISQASLNFLGVGVQSLVPTWGGMLSDGREFMRNAWWLATFPGIAITIVVLGVNLMGDGLRDALDPRLRQR